MEQDGKSLKFIISILLVVSVVFLVSAVVLFSMRQSEIEKRITLERRVDELTKEKIQLTKELDDATTAKKDLETQLGSVQDRIRLIEGQLGEEKKLRESLFSQLESEKKESKRLVEELMGLKDERERLSTDLESAKAECDTLKSEISSIQQAKEIVENKLKEILAKSQVELEKIIVKPEAATSPQSNEITPTGAPAQKAAAPNIKGEVLVVNKKFDFVVVNLGENDGINPGMDLGVYRDQRLLAMLQVEKVHANMAAARIPPEWKNVDIKEGDTVAAVK